MTTKRLSLPSIYIFLVLLLFVSFIIGLKVGAVDLTFPKIFSYLNVFSQQDYQTMSIEKGVFFQIRLPRVLLCMVVGAALSVSGALMQALFRNPIVEPGLVGTSSGAGLGAAVLFVFGKKVTLFTSTLVTSFLLPAAAFTGALTATMIVYLIATSQKKLNISTMILAGIAVNAICASGIGYLSYIARDPQARSITFWNLGTFSGADWNGFYMVALITVISVAVVLTFSKGLNAILMGESEALYLGINIETLKISIIFINTLMVAVATSLVGIIGFVGLVVPHLLRLIGSADNRYLIIGSSLLGASMLIITDTISRIIISPAELPIGIITAWIGAPVFIWLLIRQNRLIQGGGFYA